MQVLAKIAKILQELQVLQDAKTILQDCFPWIVCVSLQWFIYIN